MELTMAERKKVVRKTAKRYQKAGKREKKIILDELTALTGYSRKHAITLLANEGKTKICAVNGKPVKFIATSKVRVKRVYTLKYGADVLRALTAVWAGFSQQCGRLLAPFLRANIDVISRSPHYPMTDGVREKLKIISPRTIDRLLSKTKKSLRLRGTCGTKTTTRLQHLIPARTSFECSRMPPGYFQVDLVFHDGGNASGDFCYTLTVTDACTGWTMPFALQNKASKWIEEALGKAVACCPFPFRGIHSDNGSEFLNANIYRWCKKNTVEFTRSRKMCKNDNCFVEQKNNDAIRKLIGHARYTGPNGAVALQAVYDSSYKLACLYYPCMKLASKERSGSKVTKRYDFPRTPLERLLERDDVSIQTKLALIHLKETVPLVQEKEREVKAVAHLLQMADTVPVLPQRRDSPRRG
jgi:transposase InsO family protein